MSISGFSHPVCCVFFGVFFPYCEHVQFIWLYHFLLFKHWHKNKHVEYLWQDCCMNNVISISFFWLPVMRQFIAGIPPTLERYFSLFFRKNNQTPQLHSPKFIMTCLQELVSLQSTRAVVFPIYFSSVCCDMPSAYILIAFVTSWMLWSWLNDCYHLSFLIFISCCIK